MKVAVVTALDLTRDTDETQSERIVRALDGGLFNDARHFSTGDRGSDVDETTCHALILPNESDILALMEAIMIAGNAGLIVNGLHRLHGALSGYVEIDLQYGRQKLPKGWSIYFERNDEPRPYTGLFEPTGEYDNEGSDDQ
jgi:hypothetical protein